MPARPPAIVGVAECDLGEVPHKNVLQMQAEAARAALADAGIAKEEVDGLFCWGPWSWAPGMMLAEYMGITPRYSDSSNIGGSTFEAYVGHACAAIQAGLCNVALITYAMTPRSDRKRGTPPVYTRSMTDAFDAIFGLPDPIGAYALAASRYMHQYGVRPEQLAEVAVAARQWAALNPRAYKRDPITVADVLGSPLICDPLHLLDCCLVTDGGGALVITSAERARSTRCPVSILGHAETHTHLNISSMPDLTVTGAALTGPRALRMAGVTLADLDVVEIYDSFTITVLLTLESLGFCGPGEAGDFVAGGRIAPGGAFPLNTNGGGLSYCHPGEYGIFLLIEAVRQLRGESGPRQVNGAELALVHGTGGVLSSAATCILGRS